MRTYTLQNTGNMTAGYVKGGILDSKPAADRPLDYSNDENLTEYQNLVNSLMAAMPTMAENASPASVVAKVIFKAATDGKDQLRYTAGEDAKMLMANRQQYDDATFIDGIKSQFSL